MKQALFLLDSSSSIFRLDQSSFFLSSHVLVENDPFELSSLTFDGWNRLSCERRGQDILVPVSCDGPLGLLEGDLEPFCVRLINLYIRLNSLEAHSPPKTTLP